MVIELVLCLTVSMIVNIAMGFCWADDKVMIKQLGEYNRELWSKVEKLSIASDFWMNSSNQNYTDFIKLCYRLSEYSISKRDERGRFCGRVTAEQIVRGEV